MKGESEADEKYLMAIKANERQMRRKFKAKMKADEKQMRNNKSGE